jgi:hypothetical protein
VTFGLFDWIDRGTAPLHQLYAERLQLLEAADAEAWAAAHAAHADWYRSIMKLRHDHDDHTHDAVFAWEPSLQGETILIGSLTRVREQPARRLEVSGCNYVAGAFAWGTLPHAQALHSLRLFAEEAMPVFSRGLGIADTSEAVVKPCWRLAEGLAMQRSSYHTPTNLITRCGGINRERRLSLSNRCDR